MSETGPATPAREVPRVTHLVIALDPGGLERLVVEWTRARNRRFPGSTRIVCLDRAGRLADGLGADAVTVLHARRGRFPWDRAAVAGIRRALARSAECGAPVLHSHNLAAQQYGVLAARGRDMRHVSTQHGANPHDAGAVNRWRSRLLQGRVDRLVAVSAATADSMAKRTGAARDRIRVIPNGVSPHTPAREAVLAELRRSLEIEPRARVIGSVGRLDRVKGYDRLIDAFAALLRSGAADAQTALLLVGDGPERNALAARARNLDAASRIRFAGYRDDARCLLDLMDLFVLPSHSEGLPVSLLEAMSAGVPVLVTDAGENRAVVADGAAGRLLPTDAARWGETLRDALAESPAQQTARTREARRRVADLYSLDRSLNAYEELYRSIRNRGM